MQALSENQFTQLIEGARILEADNRGPRVYLTTDNSVIKLFPGKGLFSSNTLRPYALRFANNARRLEKMGVDSIKVEKIGHCRDLNLHFVIYPLLPGRTLRELEGHSEELQLALSRLPGFLCSLHQQGILFKAFHLGNILQQSDGGLALIDIQSMHFSKQPVPTTARIKNFLNCLRYEQDYQILHKFGFEAFFSEYLQCSGLKPMQQSALLAKLRASLTLPELDRALLRLQSNQTS